MNILWGALCEIDKKKMYVSDTFKLSDDEEIIEIYPSHTEENKHIIKTTSISKFYKTAFARIGPFLTAQGRRHMTDILYDDRAYIHRIQTDGFLTSKLIHENKVVKLGELKYEGFTENGIITNCINKVDEHY